MSFLDLAQTIIDVALVVYLWRASRPRPQKPILLDPSAPRKRRAGGVVVRRAGLALLLVSWPVQAQAQSVTTRVPSNCTDAQVLGGQADGSGVECQTDATGGSAITAGNSDATVTDAGTGSFAVNLDAAAVFALTTGGVATVGRTNTGGTVELQDGNVSIRDAGGNDFRVEADNTDILNVSSAGLRVLAGVFSHDPQASAPATCTAARDFYTDTSGAACFCSSTNTWEQLNAVGTCS